MEISSASASPSVSTATSDLSSFEKAQPAPALHRSACVRCRQRKVKCDHALSGCGNCRKSDLACVYLNRRTRKTDRARPVPTILPGVKATNDAAYTATLDDFATSLVISDDETADEDLILPVEMRDANYKPSLAIADEGRLFTARGKSRYFNNRKADEVASLERILLGVGPTSQSGPSQFDNASNDTLAGLYSPALLVSQKDPWSCHPTPSQMHVLWDYYVQNVDVCVKVLYKPTVQALVTRSAMRRGGATASEHAFLFAIWLAAITAMSDNECQKLHGESRDVLLQKYRQMLMQSLLQASWMTTQEVLTLQALVLLLVCSAGRQSRSAWMLSGVAIGIAQAMGLHRDGTSFCLNPIDTEVRRRVWWTLCLLDNRISEDCGLDVHVPLTMSTLLPLHIDDADLIDHNLDSSPSIRTEFCEMTLSLIKLEMVRTALEIKSMQSGLHVVCRMDLEDIVRKQVDRYEHTYLNYLDHSQYLHRFGILSIRLIIAKLWKAVYNVFQENDISEQQLEIEAKLLTCNAQILELAHQLPARATQYGWFFRCKYTQWHALAYLVIKLSRLQLQLPSSTVEYAWNAIDTVVKDLPNSDNISTTSPASSFSKKTQLWQPLQILIQRARVAKSDSGSVNDVPLFEGLQLDDLPIDEGYQTGELPSFEPTISPIYEAMLTEENLFNATAFEPSFGDPALGQYDPLGIY